MKDAALINYLNPELTRKLARLVKPSKYESAAWLFYEGQTPIVAYLVLEGQINLSKNRKVKYIVKAGEVLGLNELFSHRTISYSAEVLPRTSILLLDRSTIKEILSERDHQLRTFFASLLETP